MPATASSPPPPASGDTRTVADVLLDYLALEGVNCIFGVPGAAAAHLLLRLHQRGDFQFVVCRHESGAAYMADGYYRATGRPGVVLVTSGPGATNALTGAMNAHFGGSAVLVLSGEVSGMFLGRGFLQEGTDCGLNIRDIYAAGTRYSADIIDASGAPILIEQALRDMMALPRRAVHLGLLDNVAAASAIPPTLQGGLPQFVAPRPPTSPAAYRSLPTGAPVEGAERAIAAIATARRPLLMLGAGLRLALRERQNSEALRNFVEWWQIPVITTSDGKGLFPETHALSFRSYGFAGCLWPQYWMLAPDGSVTHDALLVVGSSLGELATYKWNPMLVPHGPFIQVDIDPSVIGRGYPVTDGIVAEGGAFLRALWEHTPSVPRNQTMIDARGDAIAELKANHPPIVSPENYAAETSPLQPAALCHALNELLPPDAVVFADAGNCIGWALHCLVIGPGQEFHTALAMGSMGCGVCGVIGARYGRPDRIAVALVGDGALMMHLGEISTAAAHAIGAIWIVLADNDLRMVSQGMERLFGPPGGYANDYRLGQPNLQAAAAGLGADTYAANRPADLRAAWPDVVSRAAQGRPQLLVAHIDTSPAPPFWIAPYASPQVE
jgi:acetolactate synthase-1/2/3 large subunit